MKAIKILFKAVICIVALIVVALLALPLWFGPVVKTAANAAVPGIVKTDFHMGHLHLNPYTARFELADLQLSNPTGYSEKYAATLGELTFDAETLSLATDVIHIEEITVKDVYFSLPPATLYWICLKLTTLFSPPLTTETKISLTVISSMWITSVASDMVSASKMMSPSVTAYFSE